ncbi:MAG: RNA polymerase sigma factor [candidate division Zixibacteria bacterium]|nr:RNA polymerase sigma factor [candidate division Zixibacteria bacterium]
MDINELQKSAVAGGNPEAEKQLFLELSARFRFFVKRSIWNKEDGEEAVQDALAVVFSKYKEIVYETSFVAWAHRVLQNVVMNHNSKRARRKSDTNSFDEDGRSDFGRDSDPLFEATLLECLRKVSQRSLQFARALNLNYQGYGVEEICARLELTKSNFYSVLSRARAMLTLCLQKGSL